MTVPYLMRMALLCMAAFSIVFVAASACFAILVPTAIRVSKRMKASRGAGFLLAMRLAPVAIGIFIVIAFCVPSYLRLETENGSERVGFVCLSAVCFCVTVWVLAFFRTARVILESLRWPAECAGPVIALVGVIRPRVIVSGDVERALPEDELNAALKHEEAHRTAHDNLKRLLILLTPGTMPGFAALEHAWATLAEWAADDRAAQGDAGRAITLAGALVRVAKMGSGPRNLGLATSFAANGRDLEARVDRLLNGSAAQEHRTSAMSITAGCLLAAVAAFVMLQPAVFSAVHELMEIFTD